MFGTVLGLPLHPLVLHFVVVLGPLAALAALAYVARDAWRPWLRGPLLLLTLLTAVTAFLTKESGESLAERLGVDAEKPDVTNPGAQAIADHATSGDRAFFVCALFTLLVLLTVLWAVPARGPQNTNSTVRTLCQVLTALLSFGVLWAMVSAGHSGAVAVWNGQ